MIRRVREKVEFTPLERKEFEVKRRGFKEQHVLLFGKFNEYHVDTFRNKIRRVHGKVPSWYGEPVDTYGLYVYCKNDRKLIGWFKTYEEYVSWLENKLESGHYEYYVEMI